MAYSLDDFESSRFKKGEKVRLHLYAPNGAIMKTVTGTLAAREEGVDVGGGREKTLVWIRDIEGYEVGAEDDALRAAGKTEAKTEGWFPEHDIEKIPENSLMAGLSVN